MVFRDLIVDNAGLYGVYPVECAGVLVEGCTVSGISDAAIYVGSSRDIVVRNNEVFNNVAGIEIENCTAALVTNNSAHHNTAGLLVFVLPNNPSKVGLDTRVINNRSWANNHENFGKPGTLIANLPPGIGILVMAADRTEVTQNLVAENDSYGVVVGALYAASGRAQAGRRAELGSHTDRRATSIATTVAIPTRCTPRSARPPAATCTGTAAASATSGAKRGRPSVTLPRGLAAWARRASPAKEATSSVTRP